MLIKKVKWLNHDILGNLELDFINPETAEPYNTILLAGENGTGKTTILETISTFLNKGSFEPFDFIEYKAGDSNIKAIPLDRESIKDFYDIIDEDGNKISMASNKNNPRPEIDNNPLNIRYNGCVLSKARADYKTKPIKSSTTKEIDTDKYDLDGEDDFTSLKQLLVDIQTQDNEEYYSVNSRLSDEGLPEKTVSEFYLTSKTYRFKTAFDGFFEKIKYDKVSNLDGEKSVIFTKNESVISIDDLSTGEKQIVFRGAYLLKNINNLKGAAIMIDEPELSMHPKWEQKILKYYKNLFTKDEEQTAQIFIATHSEHVLKEALKNKQDNLVIVLKEESGLIEAKNIDTPNVLPSITSAETNYLAFDIVSNDYHIELYGWLQEKEGFEESLLQCDTFIKNHSKYDSSKHHKISTHTFKNGSSRTFETLPTFVRNAIHHPSTTGGFTEEELRTSIEFLIELCK